MSRPNFEFGATVSEDNSLILWPTEGKRIALIDGDMIPYIIGYTINDMTLVRAMTRVKSGQVERIEDTPECKQACDRVNSMLNSWVYGAECDAARIFLTKSDANFRLRLAFTRPYKGTRKAEKPPFFYEMRQHLISVHGAELADGEEADDLMSIAQWDSHNRFLQEVGNEFSIGSPEHKVFSDTVIVSADKDLMIVPGWHLQPGSEMKWVEPMGWLDLRRKANGQVKDLKGAGLKFFYAQMIIGDDIDNYAGIPGRGAKYAYNLLDSCKTEKELYMAVLGAYKSKFGEGQVKIKNHRGTYRIGKAFDLMLECGRLAHMARFKGDIWRADKNPIVWGDDDSWQSD
ncbi:TPA_asm: exonulease [Salmonella enterica subsp. enterica serovar Enteritidis]|nr:exonulease [Salmonella enterica subsp. enterica serovar Enteritidis]